MTPPDVPGWYGKLPSLGDFASRRLAPAWVEHCDHWLACGLQALREAAPDDWLNDYLASPAWRFALLPGSLPEPQADELRVGVLVPSVDRVGRYFPLVVVSPPLPPPQSLAVTQALWQWAEQLEDLAVTALQDDWSADTLDQALQRLPQAGSFEPGQPLAPALAPGLAGLCHRAAWQGLQGQSLWFNHAAAAQPLQVPGLPTGTAFRTLFTPVPHPV